jgi:hypothetical protein
VFVADERLERVMALVRERLGTDSPTAIAKAARITDDTANAPRLVTNWIEGVNAPSFVYVMKLLSAAHLLMPEAEAAWRGDPLTGDLRRELEAAREALRAAARGDEERPRRARARRGR